MSTTSITPPPRTANHDVPNAPDRPRRFAQPNPNRFLPRSLAFENDAFRYDNPNQQPIAQQLQPYLDEYLDNPNQI